MKELLEGDSTLGADLARLRAEINAADQRIAKNRVELKMRLASGHKDFARALALIKANVLSASRRDLSAQFKIPPTTGQLNSLIEDLKMAYIYDTLGAGLAVVSGDLYAHVSAGPDGHSDKIDQIIRDFLIKQEAYSDEAAIQLRNYFDNKFGKALDRLGPRLKREGAGFAAMFASSEALEATLVTQRTVVDALEDVQNRVIRGAINGKMSYEEAAHQLEELSRMATVFVEATQQLVSEKRTPQRMNLRSIVEMAMQKTLAERGMDFPSDLDRSTFVMRTASLVRMRLFEKGMLDESGNVVISDKRTVADLLREVATGSLFALQSTTSTKKSRQLYDRMDKESQALIVMMEKNIERLVSAAYKRRTQYTAPLLDQQVRVLKRASASTSSLSPEARCLVKASSSKSLAREAVTCVATQVMDSAVGDLVRDAMGNVADHAVDLVQAALPSVPMVGSAYAAAELAWTVGSGLKACYDERVAVGQLEQGPRTRSMMLDPDHPRSRAQVGQLVAAMDARDRKASAVKDVVVTVANAATPFVPVGSIVEAGHGLLFSINQEEDSEIVFQEDAARAVMNPSPDMSRMGSYAQEAAMDRFMQSLDHHEVNLVLLTMQSLALHLPSRADVADAITGRLHERFIVHQS